MSWREQVLFSQQMPKDKTNKLVGNQTKVIKFRQPIFVIVNIMVLQNH